MPVVQEKISFKDFYHIQVLYHWFRRKCRLKIFIIYSFCTSGVGEMSFKDFYYLQLSDQRLRRKCRLKIFIIYSFCTSGPGEDVV